MDFDMSYIGKLAISNYPDKPQAFLWEPPVFEFIVAYDYFSKRYLTLNVTGWAHVYSEINENSPIFTLEEALKYLDDVKELIEKEKENVVTKMSSYKEAQERVAAMGKSNYHNELLHLANAYSATLRQQKDLEGYLTPYTSQAYQAICAKELKGTNKALTRLKKRFHFYFGNDADFVMSCIQRVGPCNSIDRTIKVLDKNIQRIAAYKDSLLQKLENFASLVEKE